PTVDLKTDKGWITENTVLGRSVDGVPVADTYKLLGGPCVTGGQYELRLRENEQEVTSLDAASLVAVDHASEFQAVSVGTGFALGTEGHVDRITMSSGMDVTDLTNGTSEVGFGGRSGDTLLVDRASSAVSRSAKFRGRFEVQDDADSSYLLLDIGDKVDPGEP